jgi:OOP family OmpA-OmpF porin
MKLKRVTMLFIDLSRYLSQGELNMKKYISVVFVLMLSGVYSLPGWADTSGALTETTASIKGPPTAGPAETDNNGVPRLLVEFQTAHADIPPSYSKNLNVFGKYLKDNPGSLAEIRGYADHTGNGPVNAALADKRAEAVKNYLITQCAVASSRITARGYGEISEKIRNLTEAGKQANRSVIGTITQKKS